MKNTRLTEALQIDYRLRSTFFHRKLQELGFLAFKTEIDKLIGISGNFNWDNRDRWGISNLAWQMIVDSDVPPIAVFAHPRVLQEQPRLSAYYRNVAALPQKAVNKLVLTIVSIERGKIPLPAEKALLLCRLYNSHSSLIIEGASNYTRDDALALMYTSAGAQINGSWLNRVGEEAELVTRKMLVRAAARTGRLVSVILRDGSTSTVFDDVVEQVPILSGMRLSNQTSILFSSEPDISLLNASGELVAAIEVKGGKDTAGALERYGAAKKSFEEARRQKSDARTIFLASCITDEVKKRLADDEIVTNSYNLTDIVIDEREREEFVRFVFKLLDIELD